MTIISDFGAIMKIKELKHNSQPQFSGDELTTFTKKAIKRFTIDYLKKQDGYVSSKGSFYNGIAILMRGLSGTFLMAWLIEIIPKLMNDSLLSTVAQVTTGLGSLAVAMSRLENDKAATGQSMVKVKPYISKLKEAGFLKTSEIQYGIKQFMNKKGGFYTSVIPNVFSSKMPEEILQEIEIKA